MNEYERNKITLEISIELSIKCNLHATPADNIFSIPFPISFRFFILRNLLLLRNAEFTVIFINTG